MNTAVLATVYKGVEKYFGEFCRSLKMQTYKDFRVVLINDGLEEIRELAGQSSLSMDILTAPINSTPAQNM